MTALPIELTFAHLDQDSDSVFQARADIYQMAVNINQIEAYLYNLFGFSGTKPDAIASLFSGQEVLFPAGTRVYFLQATAPPGWYQMGFDTGRYLMAVPDDTGGQTVGYYDVDIPSTSVSLIREHLPDIQFQGAADFQGDHNHTYQITEINYNSGQVSFERDANGPRAYALYTGGTTSSNGNHSHFVSCNSGGQGWGHNHVTNMAGYRPMGWKGIIGIKA